MPRYSLEETSKIIKTIDKIAFQTNLLALNAAESTSASEELNVQAEELKGFVAELTAVWWAAMPPCQPSVPTSSVVPKAVIHHTRQSPQKALPMAKKFVRDMENTKLPFIAFPCNHNGLDCI
jgi:hypothetical protein